jgi:hypothetical protein
MAGPSLHNSDFNLTSVGDRARRLVERTTDAQALPFYVVDDEVLTAVSSVLIRRERR